MLLLFLVRHFHMAMFPREGVLHLFAQGPGASSLERGPKTGRKRMGEVKGRVGPSPPLKYCLSQKGTELKWGYEQEISCHTMTR